jgi:uncharacterized repeat protein (TIGR03803 family)
MKRLRAILVLLLAACASRQTGSALPGPMTDWPAASPLSSHYQVLHVFQGSPHDGAAPDGDLISLNGTLYGTTAGGGRHCYDHGRYRGCGTVFSITPQGRLQIVYSFRKQSLAPSDPIGSLAEIGGILYGATVFGGSCKTYSGGCGTIFSVSPSGKERVLYAFKGGSDGASPSGGLIAMNGTLYGVTSAGGGSRYCKKYPNHGCGTVFAVTPAGQERIVYRFPVEGTDGAYPSGQLVALGGKLFGTTDDGGHFGHCGDGCGTIFDVTTSGAQEVLHRFDRRSQGSQPNGLTAVNGVLYGVTFNGGVNCGLYLYEGCGTVFEATTAGDVRTIYTFKSTSEGAQPQSLTAVHGVLYGTAYSGGNLCGISGAYGGALFAITTSGKKQWTYSFPCSGGILPSPGLIRLGGFLYGAASIGDEYGDGTIFTLRI